MFHAHTAGSCQPYREGQEDEHGALGLVLNAIAVWITRYLGAALDHLRATEGKCATRTARRGHLAPVTPAPRHINLHGRYFFTPSDAVAHGGLRSLGSPAGSA